MTGLIRLIRLRNQQVGLVRLTISFLLLLLVTTSHLLGLNIFKHPLKHASCLNINEQHAINHQSIKKFNILHSNEINLERMVVKRSAEISNTQNNHRNKPKMQSRVKFKSMGKNFDIVLIQLDDIITDDFTVTKINKLGEYRTEPFQESNIDVFEGYVVGQSKSHVTASFDRNIFPINSNSSKKLMTAHIELKDETIVVEPSYIHRDSINFDNKSKIDDFMIVYKLRDHSNFTKENLESKMQNFCESVSLNQSSANIGSNIDKIPESIRGGSTYNLQSLDNRKKRDIFYNSPQLVKDKTRCTLHIVVDYLFYKNIGNHDTSTTVNYVLALISRVNKIYFPVEWTFGEREEDKLSGVGFVVQNISIHDEFSQHAGEKHYNMETDTLWAAREYLDNFSKKSPPNQYCLAHLLTYRRFTTPVLGLAYVASTRFGTIGGICSPAQMSEDYTVVRHNTGISTSLGISGETLITRQADLVVAHELAHNLGAEHDSHECRPTLSNGGAYLMYPYAVMGFEKNNRFLSNCSKTTISKVLRKKAPTCFVSVSEDICGNGIIEKGEECDGGGLGFYNEDSCCDNNCRLKAGAQCSDRHSFCCSQCRISRTGLQCRQAEEFNCKEASYCDGFSAECPPSPSVEDDKTCLGRGICKTGYCMPFCEANGLISCLCQNQLDACRLCCKPSTNSTCRPYDLNTPFLPDGISCYAGICEKGRCEQHVQDVVERLWDVLEDFNFTALVKILRDNIVLVVLFLTIPIWCIFSHLIERFDDQIKAEVLRQIENSKRQKRPPSPSPFLPRLFVGDDVNQQQPSRDDGLIKPPHHSHSNAFQFPHYSENIHSVDEENMPLNEPQNQQQVTTFTLPGNTEPESRSFPETEYIFENSQDPPIYSSRV